MSLRCCLTLGLFVLAVAPAWADKNEFQARFRDGTVIGRAGLQEPIEVVTRFGKLSIPAAEINHIEFGLHVPEDKAKQVGQAVASLGSGNFKEREQASKTLVAAGVYAYAALQRAAKSDDKEVAKRAQQALDQVRASTPAGELNAKPEDRIHAAGGSVIVGKIVGTAFKAETANFGALTFQLSDLRTLHNVARLEKQVVVEAAKHTGEWLDTGIDCEPAMGLRIVITESSDVDPNGVGARAYGQASGVVACIASSPPALNRPVREGLMHLVQNRLEGKPAQKGRLYLRVVGSSNHKVKINLLPDYQGASLPGAPSPQRYYAPATAPLPGNQPPPPPPPGAAPVPLQAPAGNRVN